MGGLAAMLCAMAFGLVLVALVGGVILRAACALFNKFVSDPAARVAEPNFLPAAGIVIAAALVNMVVGFTVGFVIGAGFGPDNLQAAQYVSSAIALPLSILVMAALLSAMLPTTFLRGLAIAGLYLLIALAIVTVIAILVFVVVFALSAV